MADDLVSAGIGLIGALVGAAATWLAAAVAERRQAKRSATAYLRESRQAAYSSFLKLWARVNMQMPKQGGRPTPDEAEWFSNLNVIELVGPDRVLEKARDVVANYQFDRSNGKGPKVSGDVRGELFNEMRRALNLHPWQAHNSI